MKFFSKLQNREMGSEFLKKKFVKKKKKRRKIV